MRMDKLTHLLQAALGEAQSLAIGRDHPFIEPLHLLKAMVDPAGSGTRALLLAAGATVEPLQASLDSALGAMATVSGQ
jgi:ATP-dependent Clp protease ATP-binding subunit ClpB